MTDTAAPNPISRDWVLNGKAGTEAFEAMSLERAVEATAGACGVPSRADVRQEVLAPPRVLISDGENSKSAEIEGASAPAPTQAAAQADTPSVQEVDPGVFGVEELLTAEEERRILAEVSEELLVSGDSEILPERADGFITEEQEADILLEMADWMRTFLFAGNGRYPNG
jgi:hypothetical protein